MNCPTLRSLPAVFTALLLCCLGFFASSARAAEVKKEFDIPRDSATAMLKKFSAQSGEQLLYSIESIANVALTPVKGAYTPREALEQMVDGTPLRVVVDRKNGAISLVRQADPNAPSRPADATAANELRGEPRRARVENGALQLEKFEVTGSRIRRDPQELGANPVFVYTRADIERSGAISIADFTNRLPQNTDDLAGLNTGFVSSPTGARTTVNLRGLGNGTTLILINGRRMPKSGQGFDQDNYDLSSIPLAAIERIEVLTDGASAVYGADAIAGVINIIMRRDFAGTELTLQYGNTFHTDAGEFSASITTGFSRDKLRAFLTATYRERNSFGATARPYTATADFSASGGRDGRYDYVGGAGFVTTDSFDPLPGLTTESAGIPPNQDGRSLTPADFLPYDGISEKFDWAPYLDTVLASRLESVRSSFEYEASPRASIFLDAAFSVDRNVHRGPPPATWVFVPASNPFNPFGVDVWVDKTFYELGRSETEYESRNLQLTGGVRGDLFGDWRYELGGAYARNTADSSSRLPDWIGGTLADPLLELTDPNRALNVFGDGRTTNPNAPGVLEAAIGIADYKEVSQSATADARADGTLFKLPMGDVRLALGGEYREEKISFEENNTTDSGFVGVDKNVDRQVLSGHAELLVPLVHPEWAWPLMRSLEVQLAGRADRYPRFGTEFSPKVSLSWRPVKSLLLRGSLAEGFKAPNLYSLERPFSSFTTRLSPFRPFTDPVRGDLITQFLQLTQGGNPDLRAERSQSESVGFVYEPAFAPGLSVSADYFHVDFQDKVVHFVAALDILNYFPERITRGAPTPEDVAVGLPGRITALDLRAVNMASSETTGVDVRLAYDRDAESGRWTFMLEGTRMLTFEDQATVSSPRLQRVGTLIYPKWRVNASLFWKREAWEVGVRWRYIHESAQAFRGAIPLSPSRIDAAQEIDLAFAYDFGPRSGEGWRNYLNDVRLGIDIVNVLDTEPPNTNGAGGYAHLDPRQRRFQITLRKAF